MAEPYQLIGYAGTAGLISLIVAISWQIKANSLRWPAAPVILGTCLLASLPIALLPALDLDTGGLIAGLVIGFAAGLPVLALNAAPQKMMDADVVPLGRPELEAPLRELAQRIGMDEVRFAFIDTLGAPGVWAWATCPSRPTGCPRPSAWPSWATSSPT